MLSVVISSVVLGYLLLVWLRTDAFVEYMTLLKLSHLFHIDEYKNIHEDGYVGNYVDFMVEYYRKLFFVRLMACPVCISFWLGLISISHFGILYGFLISPLALFFYLLLNRML